MIVLWLIQFSIVILQIILGILFVLAKGNFFGSVFETQGGELKLKLNNWGINISSWEQTLI